MALMGCGTHAQVPPPTTTATGPVAHPAPAPPTQEPPSRTTAVVSSDAHVMNGTLRLVVMHEDALARSTERELTSLVTELQRHHFQVTLVTEPSVIEDAFLSTAQAAVIPPELSTFEYIVSLRSMPNGQPRAAHGLERLTIRHLPATTPAFQRDTTVYLRFDAPWLVSLIVALDIEEGASR